MAAETAEMLTKFRPVTRTRRDLRLALAALDRAEIARRQAVIARRRTCAAQRCECERLLLEKLAA